jgi:hypothetical protein
MHRLNVSLVCLLSVTLVGSAFVRTANSQSDTPGVATYDSYSGGATLGAGSFLNVRYMSGNGVGYQNGYTQIGGMVPFWMGENAFIGPDVKLLLGNNSQVGGNLGGIARYYIPEADRIIGAAAYFDMDQSNYHHTYTQGTFGLETLGQFWDLRGNAYYVPGTEDNFISNGIPLCVSGNPFFSGNNIVFQGQQAVMREQAMSGVDAEFGMPLNPATPWLRGYAGLYYYHAKQYSGPPVDQHVPNRTDSSPLGFRARMDAWIADDLLVGVNFTTDPVWGNNVNAVVDFRFSGFKPTRYFPQWTTRERMLAPWQRNWRIAVEQYGTVSNSHLVTALNPATNKPYFVTFIDDRNPNPGTGTFQNPFKSFNHPGGIPQADIIVVEKGNSSAANPYKGSIKLFDNQRLLGEGAITSPLPLTATYGNCTVNGSFQLPTLGPGRPHPFVESNTGLPPVTLANNNELAGFTIVNTSGVVIGGDPANINIHDVTLVGSGNASTPAISITNLTGANNIIKNVNVLTPGGIGNNPGGGIYLQSGTGGATLTMTNVFMNSAPPYLPAPGGKGAQQPFGIWLNAPAPGPANDPNSGGSFNVTMNNVHVNGNVLGLKLTETRQNMNVNLQNFTADNNTGTGIQAIGNGGQITVTGNTVGSPISASGNTGDNVNVSMTNGGVFNGTFANALFNGSTAGSGIVLNQAGGSATLNLTNTNVNTNAVDGLRLNASGGAAITVTGTGDQLVGNGRDGINNVAGGAGTQITENFSNSLINSSGRNGVFYSLANGALLNGTFSGDQINSSKTSAFSGQIDNATANLTISGTSANNSLGSGFVLNETNGAVFTGNITNSNINVSGGNGMLVGLLGGSTGTFNLTGTSVSGNIQNGVSFTANQSVYNLTSVTSLFNSNKANGILGSLSNGSTANVSTGTNSAINANTQNGVFVTSASGSNFAGVFDNTTINNNTNANGIWLNLANSPNSTLSLTGTTSLINNGTNGLRVDASSGTVFTPTIVGTAIRQNGADGVKLTALGGSQIGTAGNAGSFTNALIQDNKLNGVEVAIGGAGSKGNLVFTNDLITNTVGNAPQKTGFLYSATGGGNLTASFGGGTSLKNNNINALNGTVAGTGAAGSSVATINLTGVDASGSGQTNSLLNVTLGGLATINATNTNFSNSVNGSGMGANVSNVNSTANINLDSVTLDGNKVVGFGGSVSAGAPGVGQTGANLNVCLDNSSVSNNTLQGIAVSTFGSGATASFGVGQFNVPNTASNVNFNGSEGVLANASAGGTINFRSIGSHFDGNGTSVVSDGLNFGGNNGHIYTLFNGGSANSNTGDGLRLGGIGSVNTFGSDFTTSLQNGFSLSNNGADSLNFEANNASTAYLLMDSVTPPVLTGPINLNFAGTTTAVASMTGTFHWDGFTGNGLTANFSGAKTAVFSLDGKGTSTANNNTLGGINVNMDNTQKGSVRITGFSDISGNQGGDGIRVSMIDSVTGTGAIQLVGVPGQTTMIGNAGTGVNVQLTNVNLVNGLNPGLPLITGLSTSSNQGLNACLPLPGTVASGATVPASALTVDNFNVTKSLAITGTGGIYVNGTNATFSSGGGSISNNTVSNMGGDGIKLQLHNGAFVSPTADGFKLKGNSSTGNTGNGINIDLVNATMLNLDMTGTTTVTGNTKDGLHINADGSTMTRTVDVTPVNINASTNKTNGVFLNAINGSNVFLDVDKLTADGNTGGAGFTGNASGGSTLNACFDTGSSLSGNSLQGLNITVDGAGSVSSFNIHGATVNTNTQQGLLATVTNAGQLNYRSIGTTYNSNGTGATKFDGVDLRADATTGATKSTILSLFDSSTANNNGRDGFHIGGLSDGASTNGANMTISLSNNTTATGNGRNALNFNAPNATSANLLMDATTNLVGPTLINVNGVSNQVVLQLIGTSFSNNAGGDGLNLVFDSSVSGIQTAFVSLDGVGTNTIDNNNGNGLSVTMKGLTNGSVLVQNYASISNNAKDGVFVSMTDVKNGAVQIQGQGPAAKTTMSGNKFDAVEIQLLRTSLINNLAGVSAVPGLTTTSNQSPAALNCLPLPTNLPVTNLNVIPAVALKVDSLNVSNSGASGGTGGIIANGTDSTIAASQGFFTNNIVTGSTNGGGIGVTLNNNTVTNQTIDTVVFSNNTVTNNAGDGIAFKMTNASAGGTLTVKNVNFTNNTVTGNTGRGIVDSLTNNGAATTVVATGSSITGNTVGGNQLGGILDTITNNAASIINADNRQLSNNTVTSNVGDGIAFKLFNAAAGKDISANNLVINGNTVTGNAGSGNGIVDSITNNAANVTVTANGAGITGNSVKNNTGNGIVDSIINNGAGVNLLATNMRINNNIVTDNNGVGIVDTILNNAAATSIQASGTQVNTNTVSKNKAGGILDTITNNVATTTIADNRLINGNTVNNNTGYGIREAILNGAGKTTSANGLSISANTVTGNTVGQGISNTLGGGATITANNVLISGDTVSGNAQDGVALNWTNVTSNGVNLNALRSTNNLGAGNGLLVNLTNSSLSNVTLNSTVMTGNKANGVRVNMNGSTIAGLTASNVNYNFNSQNGLGVVASNASSLTGATFTNASFQNNGYDGVNFNATDLTNSTFGTVPAPIVFNSSIIRNNGQAIVGADGVRVRLYGGSTGNLQFNSTQIGNTGAGVTQKYGFDFIAGTGATSGKLTAAFTNSNIQGNGIDGILGVVNGTGVAGVSSANINVAGSTIQTNKGNGVTLTVNNAGTESLTVSGNSLIDGNGSDGVNAKATGTGTTLNATITNSSVTNNGATALVGLGNGMTLNLDNNARGNVTVTNAVIGNSAPGGFQKDGLLLNVNQAVVGANTQLFANITSSTLSNNSVSAIFADITGSLAAKPLIPPSVPLNVKGAHVTLNAVTAANNGGNGMAFLVDGNAVGTGGFLDLTVLNGTTISGSGQNGLFIDASDSMTLVSASLQDSQFINNGTLLFPGDGFNSTVSTGATLNVCAETSTGSATPMAFSGNTGDGLDVQVGGVGSRADIDLHEVIAGADLIGGTGLTGNTLNGVSTSVYDGGVTNLRANTTHFDGNFGAGLSGYVKDALGFDTVGRFNIIGGSADKNAGDGYSLLAENTTAGPTGVATLTAQFQADDGGNGISAQGNGGFGLSFVASNPPVPAPAGGIVGNLLMTGGSTLLNNGAGTLNVNMNGADQAIIALSGTFDGSTNGDGIHIALSNITGLALVSLQGPGEVMNNAGDGIDVSMSNVGKGAVFIGGFTDVSNNGTANNTLVDTNNVRIGQDGIKVTMTAVTLGAVKIDGATATLPAMNVSNNTGNGVNVTINGGTKIDNVAFNTFLNQPQNKVDLIDYTKPEAPCPTPLPNPLLTTTLTNVSNALGFSFINPGFSIQNLNVDSNGILNPAVTPVAATNTGGDGIVLTATGVGTTIVDTPLITLNTITNTGAGSGTGTHDGVLLQVSNSADVKAINVTNNDIETNVGNGVNMTFQNAKTLANVNLDVNTISNNTVNGVLLSNPDTVTPLALNLSGNTIDNNGSVVANTGIGSGVEVLLNSATRPNEILTLNVLGDTNINQISNNKSFGVHIDARQAANYTLNVTSTGGQQIFDGNSDAGIGIEASAQNASIFSTGSVTVKNVLIENSLQNFHNAANYPFNGDGLAIQTKLWARVTNFVVGDSNLRNTVFDNNGTRSGAYAVPPPAGSGVAIYATDNSSFVPSVAGAATVMLQNVDTTNNKGDGINILRRDSALLSQDTNGNKNIDGVLDATNAEEFIHVRNMHATGNTRAGFNVLDFNGQFVTRIDIVDTAPVANTFTPAGTPTYNGNSIFNGNGIGMKFLSQNDAILVLHVEDTDASSNTLGDVGSAGTGAGNGIYLQTTESATIGNTLPLNSTPTLGDVNDPHALDQFAANPLGNVVAQYASTFNGMNMSNNRVNGLEMRVDDATKMIIQMTNSATNFRQVDPLPNQAGNSFDMNTNNGIQLTTSSSATLGNSQVNIDLNHINITNSLNSQVLTNDGINIVTNGASGAGAGANRVTTNTINLRDTIIGALRPASSTAQGLGGDGIDVTTNGASRLTFNVGDQSIPIANVQVGGPNDPSQFPDISMYGNRNNGMIVRNNSSSQYFGTLYDVASDFNGIRGYSALMAGQGSDDPGTIARYNHTIDYSVFNGNSREGIGFVTNTGVHNQILLQFATNSLGDIPTHGDSNDYMRLTTDLHAALRLTNSIVSNNGNPTPYNGTNNQVHGLLVDAGTNSLIMADIRSNTFSGNVLDDLRTQTHVQTNGGFDANGNPTGAAINTNPTVDRSSPVDDVYRNETAQLDIRFMHNKGDQVNITSFLLEPDVIFGNRRDDVVQVNAYHMGTMAGGATATSFTGTTLLALDDPASGSVTDPATLPAPTTYTNADGVVNNTLVVTNPAVPGSTATPITPGHGAGYYTNTDPKAFIGVRVDNRTDGTSAIISGYNPATGTFTLAGAGFGAAPTAGAVFRIHLLDTNTFNQSNTPQNVQTAFTANGTAPGFGYFQQVGMHQFGDPNPPGPTPGLDSTPLDPYFVFPDQSVLGFLP